METLLKIIEEKMLLIEKLESQLIEAQNLVDLQKEETQKQTDSMLYWFDKFNKLNTTKDA